VLVLAAAGLLAACSSNAATPTTTSTTAGSTTASTGSSAPVVATASKASVGTVLVASNGHTLYRLTTDTPTSSTCSGSCAQLWPPLTVPAGTTPRAASGVTGTLGTITRSDGTVQVVYEGHPLYTYAPDTTAADVLGQGVGGIWFVVSPSGSSSSTTSPPTTAARSGSGY
jgi:predicted lipoprotein with Yx(FWY)xxD motif